MCVVCVCVLCASARVCVCDGGTARDACLPSPCTSRAPAHVPVGLPPAHSRHTCVVVTDAIMPARRRRTRVQVDHQLQFGRFLATGAEGASLYVKASRLAGWGAIEERQSCGSGLGDGKRGDGNARRRLGPPPTPAMAHFLAGAGEDGDNGDLRGAQLCRAGRPADGHDLPHRGGLLLEGAAVASSAEACADVPGQSGAMCRDAAAGACRGLPGAGALAPHHKHRHTTVAQDEDFSGDFALPLLTEHDADCIKYLG